MITVQELSEKYMKEHAIRKKKSSAEEDKRMWNLHILPELGSYKVSSVIKDDIAKLHSAMSDKPITANRCRALISKAFNLAEGWGYRPEGSNPCLHVKAYPESKKERFLSQDEINDLHHTLNACEADGTILPNAAAAIRLLMLTGCRLSEILTLKWKYVDFDNNILDLPDSKTGPKKVHISPLAAEYLKSMRDDPERDEENPYVIAGKDSESHLINLQLSWQRVRKKAKLEDVRLHDLRHTFASIAVSQGLSLPAS